MLFGCCVNKSSDVALLRKIGFDYFEFSGASLAAMTSAEFENLLAEQNRCSLPCRGLNAYCSGNPAIVGDNFDPTAIDEYADLVFRRASVLGAKTVGIGAPRARRLPSGYSDALADEQCAKFLAITAAKAEDYGIKLLLEAVHSGMCNYLTTTEQVVFFIKKYRPKNVSMVLDFYHMEVMGENLKSVDLAKSWICHTHISTWGDGFYRGFPQMDEIEKYTKYMESLLAVGYDGSMSIEPSDFEYKAAKDSLLMLRRARQLAQSE